MATVEYLPIANNPGANVRSQANYQTDLTSGNLTLGYTSGIANSAQINKTLRQSSVVSVAFATFVANTTGLNLVDDGNVIALSTNINLAISTLSNTVASTVFTNTFYSGSNATITSYPIGSYLQITSNSGPGTPNSNVTVYYGDALSFTANYFSNSTTNANFGPLDGVWKHRGGVPTTGANIVLVQRVL